MTLKITGLEISSVFTQTDRQYWTAKINRKTHTCFSCQALSNLRTICTTYRISSVDTATKSKLTKLSVIFFTRCTLWTILLEHEIPNYEPPIPRVYDQRKHIKGNIKRHLRWNLSHQFLVTATRVPWVTQCKVMIKTLLLTLVLIFIQFSPLAMSVADLDIFGLVGKCMDACVRNFRVRQKLF